MTQKEVNFVLLGPFWVPGLIKITGSPRPFSRALMTPTPPPTLKKFWTLPSLSAQEKSPPTDISKNPSIKLKIQKSNKSSMQQKRNSFVI
jgi:hypothetical protein